jgi:hypothetical protein
MPPQQDAAKGGFDVAGVWNLQKLRLMCVDCGGIVGSPVMSDDEDGSLPLPWVTD